MALQNREQTVSATPLSNSRPESDHDQDFPRSKDGDVAFVLSPTRIYYLHAVVLRNRSALLSKLLTNDNAAYSASTARRGSQQRFRWRIELVQNDVPDASHGRIALRMLDEKSRPVGEAPGVYYNDLDAATIANDEFHHWDNLLRSFYGLHANIRSEEGIGSVLPDVMKLIDLAEYVGGMRSVSATVDLSLAEQGQVLFQSIARSPAAWAGLAMRIRSEIVFKEAVIHLIGQWPRLLHEVSVEVAKLASGTGTPRDAKNQRNGGEERMETRNMIADLDYRIRKLCHRKHQTLEIVKRDIERRLLSHYPEHLHRNGGGEAAVTTVDIPNVGAGSKTVRGLGHSVRAQAYGQDVLSWMALGLFRHFVGQMISTEDGGSRALDGGFCFFNAVGRGGDAYLDRDCTEQFVKIFPLSAKSRSLFEEQMGLLKESVRQYVKDLIQKTLMLDTDLASAAGVEVDYLACAVIKHKDMPWVVRHRGGDEELLPWPGEQPEPAKGAEYMGVPFQDVSFSIPGSTSRAAGRKAAVEKPIGTSTDDGRAGGTDKRRQRTEDTPAEASSSGKRQKRQSGSRASRGVTTATPETSGRTIESAAPSRAGRDPPPAAGEETVLPSVEDNFDLDAMLTDGED